ncbi:hypothetical protein JK359_32330 [Streptomyces actinomycinicus]|uniref:Uncharacterized protein n=1 Tax=Streptomyces actinomycinicus TaxID=1695166 RepID=A0A937JTB6_9ACTN|nr:hypothetical protein [Streptomyces actinomycinicus]MBL1086593.1 hypothetical protein [Streptomyces actinomycinicus]
MRSEVQAFFAAGPLPNWDASEEEISKRERQLALIPQPVTPEEATALASCFGPDDCYGLAWTLVHLIETAPGPLPRIPQAQPDAGAWQRTLSARWGGGEPTT